MVNTDNTPNTALTPNNVLSRLEKVITEVPVYPNTFNGEGIVICGGGNRYFPSIWVCIRMLRRLGCLLPIEIWHLGEHEISEDMKALVAPLNVQCVDALEIRKTAPCRILNGWELKSYAIIHSRFREVLLLDADNVPVLDPTFLFNEPSYELCGATFWPDKERLPNVDPSYNPRIWSMCGIVPPWGWPEFETGQILVNKQKCWRPLCLTMWFNEYSDFFYRYVYGDKETFNLAWRKLDVPFAMPPYPVHNLPNTFCQHAFDGRRLFQHRHHAKWALRANTAIPGFLYENDCLAFLSELALHWDGCTSDTPRFSVHRCQVEEVNAAVKFLVSSQHLYERVGYDKRLMSFNLDGTVAQGGGGCEVFWDIQQEDGILCLSLSSASELTCKLYKDRTGAWIGTWQVHERMFINLSPYSVDVEWIRSHGGAQTSNLSLCPLTINGLRSDAARSVGGNAKIEEFAKCLVDIDAFLLDGTDRSNQTVGLDSVVNPSDGSRVSVVEPSIVCVLTNGIFRYQRVGHDDRLITFSSNGEIAAGRADCEKHWILSATKDRHCILYIMSDEAITCSLVAISAVEWRGISIYHDRLPTILQLA